jgi:hypothetical protein
MTDHSPFDRARDAALGAALGDVLAVGDDAAFVRRVLERAGAPETWWEVLEGWARPGMAAALLLVAAGAFLLGRAVGPAGDGARDVAITDLPSVEVSGIFGVMGSPSVETVLNGANEP